VHTHVAHSLYPTQTQLVRVPTWSDDGYLQIIRDPYSGTFARDDREDRPWRRARVRPTIPRTGQTPGGSRIRVQTRGPLRVTRFDPRRGEYARRILRRPRASRGRPVRCGAVRCCACSQRARARSDIKTTAGRGEFPRGNILPFFCPSSKLPASPGDQKQRAHPSAVWKRDTVW
jgi:hypothetical protein